MTEGDLDFASQLEAAFGSEPPLPPMSHTIDIGRRALRRRRVVTSGASIALGACVLAGTGLTFQAAQSSGPAQEAQEASTSATDGGMEAMLAHCGAAVSLDGKLTLATGVEVIRRVDDVASTFSHSAAIDLRLANGHERWVVIGWQSTSTSNGTGMGCKEAVKGSSFPAYVAQLRGGAAPQIQMR